MLSFLFISLHYVAFFFLGVALHYAYAPYNQGWIVWVFSGGLLLFLWTFLGRFDSERQLFWRGFRMAYVCGFGFWVCNAHFVGAVSQRGGWMSSSLMALYLALYCAVYGGWAMRMRPRQDPSVPMRTREILLLSAWHGGLWCGLEWLRGLTRVSFGWDGLGVSFMDSYFLLAQAADLVGVNGLSFLPVFTGAAFSYTILEWRRAGGGRPSRAPFVAIVLIMGTFFYGKSCLKREREQECSSLRALLVQQNTTTQDIHDEAKVADIYEGYADELERAFQEIQERGARELQQKGTVELALPDLVILPESSLPSPFYVDTDGGVLPGQPNWVFYEESIRIHGDFLLVTGANLFPTMLTEGGYSTVDQEGRFYNSVAFFRGSMSEYSHRPKSHLMPFGEYLPFSSLSFVQKFYAYSAGMTFQGAFTPAQVFEPELVTLHGREYSVLPTVCYEDTVSRVVRKYYRWGRSQYIINVTNDGWFAGTACAEKHFQNARYRSIEYRVPLIRAANTGVSGVVESTGASSQVMRDATGSTEFAGSLEVDLRVPHTPSPTVYARIGDLFCWGGGALSLLGSLVWQRRT